MKKNSTPTPAAAHADTRPYLLERVGEAAVVQLYADGFEALPRREKILIYHLYQAAIAGRDIYYDQRYAHNLEMRASGRLSPRGRYPGGYVRVDPSLHRFSINSGPYKS
jgi:dipeptidyl-peptidase-3